jgi:hypothetical protein
MTLPASGFAWEADFLPADQPTAVPLPAHEAAFFEVGVIALMGLLMQLVAMILAIFTMLLIGFLARPFLAGDHYAALMPCNPIKGCQSRGKCNPGPFALATDERIRMAERAI